MNECSNDLRVYLIESLMFFRVIIIMHEYLNDLRVNLVYRGFFARHY